jgi:hypothetical protein
MIYEIIFSLKNDLYLEYSTNNVVLAEIGNALWRKLSDFLKKIVSKIRGSDLLAV